MLRTLLFIVILLWLLGWGFHVAGGLIHLLLVIIVVLVILEIIGTRRRF